jgi:hypothetical protein
MDVRILGPFEVTGNGRRPRTARHEAAEPVGVPGHPPWPADQRRPPGERAVARRWLRCGPHRADLRVPTAQAARRRRCAPRHPTGGYVLEVDPTTVDASRFERAVTASGTEADAARRLALHDGALELWRGRPLGEFEGTAWADREATWLEALRLPALQRRCDPRIDLGRAGRRLPSSRASSASIPRRAFLGPPHAGAVPAAAGRPMPSGPTSRPGTSSSRGWASNRRGARRPRAPHTRPRSDPRRSP